MMMICQTRVNFHYNDIVAQNKKRHYLAQLSFWLLENRRFEHGSKLHIAYKSYFSNTECFPYSISRVHVKLQFNEHNSTRQLNYFPMGKRQVTLYVDDNLIQTKNNNINTRKRPSTCTNEWDHKLI